jgi:hypothetical protein
MGRIRREAKKGRLSKEGQEWEAKRGRRRSKEKNGG